MDLYFNYIVKNIELKFLNNHTAKPLQSCPTLCEPIGGSPRGSRPWDSPGKNTGVGCHFLLQNNHTTHLNIYLCIYFGEGNGTPLHYSCLEDPMGRGTWWAAVHGVTKESDTTEQLHLHFSLSSIGEGNGNPLQCSCLENPRDGRAWWVAVHGVVQSQTRLKWLSSSSSSSNIVKKPQ